MNRSLDSRSCDNKDSNDGNRDNGNRLNILVDRELLSFRLVRWSEGLQFSVGQFVRTEQLGEISFAVSALVSA